MTSKKEKGFRKLNKNHVWSVLVLVLFISVATAILMSFFSLFFVRYVIESRVESEYETFSSIKRIYEKTEPMTEKEFSILDDEGRTYFIKDKDGNVIHGSGEDTIGDEVATVKLSPMDKEYKVCADKEEGYVYPEDGKISFDIAGAVNWINDTDKMDRVEMGREVVRFPLWIVLDIEGTGEQIFGKMYFELDMADFALIAGFTIAIAILSVIVIILLFVHSIASVVRQRKLTNLFFMDEVTGGKNWMWFIVKGEAFLKKRSSARNRYAVLDVVFVNYRNYCVCHSVKDGEKMLKKVEDCINSRLTKKEMCAHYASANFAVLLRVSNEETLKARINELLDRLAEIDPNHKFNFRIGVDAIDVEVDKRGKAVKRRHVDLEKEYNNACAARSTLEDTDETGVAFFNDSIVEEQKWLDIVQERQQSAVDNNEFVVYYQPKYDPRTDKLLGAEALIRWRTREGLKGPGSFIPIFEKNGFITEIDHYMIKHVARDQKKWLDEGLNCVPVSVNVSRAHFIEPDLAEQIRDMVDAEGTPHNLIEIELTESAFFDDKKALVNTIGRLKKYGFAVSMDDFGAGYSSLNSLKDMPLDVLKLDAEFFRGDMDDERGEIVVSEAIKLAKSLNMKTVAEGIEAKDQVEFLAKQGCDMIQGYIYAKPMPEDKFVKRIKSGTHSVDDNEDDD